MNLCYQNSFGSFWKIFLFLPSCINSHSHPFHRSIKKYIICTFVFMHIIDRKNILKIVIISNSPFSAIVSSITRSVHGLRLTFLFPSNFFLRFLSHLDHFTKWHRPRQLISILCISFIHHSYCCFCWCYYYYDIIIISNL